MTSAMPTSSAIYFWFDLEFTDLDPAKAQILQVAAWATDVHLQPLMPDDRGLNLILRLEDNTPVSPWVEDNLADLLKECRSPRSVPPGVVEIMLMRYLDRVAGPPAADIKDRPVLAGNSVHNDWRLAAIHYPALVNRLSYRLLDVSTLKQQWQGWMGQEEFNKEDAACVQAFLPEPFGTVSGARHDAYYDILASIAELNYYRQKLLRDIPAT
jgi:oligoribonuclease